MGTPEPAFSYETLWGPPASAVDPALTLALVATVAVIFDWAIGDLPNRVHPVAWFGTLVAPMTASAGRRKPGRDFLAGMILAAAAPLSWTGVWMAVLTSIEGLPWLHFLLSVFLLQSTFALRDLGRAALGMAEALDTHDLAESRSRLSSLCSRDATSLTREQLAQGTIESVAENASDSVVAPLFYLALFGLPGALFYRAVNTLDAMVGYHGRFEFFGKASARLDDVLNWIPARITAGLLLASGALRDGDVVSGYRIMRDHGSRTESPNAGRPMAAMAGLLGVELGKPGQYTLGVSEKPVGPAEIHRAWKITEVALLIATAMTMVVLALKALMELS